MATKNIDEMPPSHVDEPESEEEEEKRVFAEESWMTYFEPAQLRTLITKRWIKMSSYIGIYYMF